MRTTIFRRFAVVLAACAAGLVLPVAAAHAADPEIEIDPDGHTLVVRMDVTVTPGTDDDVTEYRITRSVGVLNPDAVTPSGAVAACEDDSSLSVQVCGTVVYSSYKSNNIRYASMSQVGNQANRLDRQARITRLDYLVGANGPCGRGCAGSPSHSFDGHLGSPVSGHNYPWNVSWSGQYQRVSASPLDGQGLRQTLTWGIRNGTYYLRNAIDVPN